jgi:hypothetical protein
MNKIEFAKATTTFVVGLGTSKIVHQIIRNNTNPENVIDTVTMFAGSVAIGSLVADATRAHTDAKIDEMVTWYNATFKKTSNVTV